MFMQIILMISKKLSIFLDKSPIIKKFDLKNQTTLNSPLSKAEAVMFIYEFIKLQNDALKIPFPLEFYNKYLDVDSTTDFFTWSVVLANYKWSDEITVLSSPLKEPYFKPLSYVSQSEFIKMLVEVLDLKKEKTFSNINSYKDYTNLSDEQKLYYTTAFKNWIIKHVNDIQPDKNLTVYDALVLLQSVLSKKNTNFTEKSFVEPTLENNKIGKRLGMIPEDQDYDPSITGFKIKTVNTSSSWNCMILDVVAEMYKKAKTSYVWSTNFGYFRSLNNDNTKVLFCPSTRKPIVDFYIKVEGTDRYMHFDEYNFTISSNKFKYEKNIADDYPQLITRNIKITSETQKLVANKLFSISMSWWFFYHNFKVWLEAVSVVINDGNTSYFINNAKFNSKEIYFVVPSMKDSYWKDVKLHIIYATNYKFGEKKLDLTSKPIYIINWQVLPDKKGNIPKYVFINWEKVEVFDGSFFYTAKDSGTYTITVKEKGYNNIKITLTDSSPTKYIYLSYEDYDFDNDGVDNIKDAYPYDPCLSKDSDKDGYPDYYNTWCNSAMVPLDKFPHDPYRYLSKYDATSGEFYGYLTYSKCVNFKQKWRFIDILAYSGDNCFFFYDYKHNQVFYLVDEKDINTKLANLLKPYVNYSIYIKGVGESISNRFNNIFPRCNKCRIFNIKTIEQIKAVHSDNDWIIPKISALIKYQDYLKLDDILTKVLKKRLSRYKKWSKNYDNYIRDIIRLDYNYVAQFILNEQLQYWIKKKKKIKYQNLIFPTYINYINFLINKHDSGKIKNEIIKNLKQLKCEKIWQENYISTKKKWNGI